MDAEIYISYSQIAVFDTSLTQPFNDWSKTHTRQGFAWRPGSVSFGTLSQNGECDITIEKKMAFEMEADASIVIRVPFTVPPLGKIEFASISDGFIVKIEPGLYSLTYEHGLRMDGKMWCKFTFVKEDGVSPEIIRSDGEINPILPLLMEAEPA